MERGEEIKQMKGKCREGVIRKEEDKCRGQIVNCKECGNQAPTCKVHKTKKGMCSKECEEKEKEREELEEEEVEEYNDKTMRHWKDIRCLRGHIKNEEHLCSPWKGGYPACQECEWETPVCEVHIIGGRYCTET